MRREYYDLYQLRQLTESIFCVRQQLGVLDKESFTYKRAVELYEKLWQERDELESKIINMCNKKIDEGLIVTNDED
jgi:hypothetical protein